MLSSDNPILKTDSYKVSHYKQYPPLTTNVYSYFESRGGDYKETTFFGLQYIIKKHLLTPVDEGHVHQAQQIAKDHFGTDFVNVDGWTRIIKHHEGRLPLFIKAVPEGLSVPTGNVLMTVENTDSELPWLTNYVETILSQVWYPTTVATLSREVKKVIQHYLDLTGNDPSEFKLHDFGYRGSTSHESAGIGGVAHLVNFRGTDTLSSITFARDYYNCKMGGFSIPAAEHSTITSWGKKHEIDAFRNMLEQYPKGLVAVVSDSYNIFDAADIKWGVELHDKVMERDGCVVIRPDSGYPPHVTLKLLEILEKRFGVTYNKKGYKVLDPHVRIIQGDGCDPQMIREILKVMAFHYWSADNIAFGMGGGLLQKVNRDTCKFAFKCSSVIVDGKERDVWKDPITDPNKWSKRGRLALINHAQHGYMTLPVMELHSEIGDAYAGMQDVLHPVYKNGQLLIDESLDVVRQRARL